MNSKSSCRVISNHGSLTLDGLRLLSALTVVFAHAYDQYYPGEDAHNDYIFRKISHSAVVYFFVISGYVISYTTINNNRGVWQYANARLSRLSAVVIPALVITAIAQLIIRVTDVSLYLMFSRGADVLRYLLSATFLNEVWFISTAPPINIPLWSLSFEFWYYAIFGAWFFRKKKGVCSILPVLITCLIAGPKILIMMPIWVMGYLAYTIPQPKLSKVKAWILMFSCIVAGILSVIYIEPFPNDIGSEPFYFANRFLSDYLIGICFGTALWLMPLNNVKINVTQNTLLFRKVADFTFPIYVLHYPLLILWRAFLPGKSGNIGHYIIGVVSILVISSIFGFFIEKQRRFWIVTFSKLIAFVQQKFTSLKHIYKTT